MCYKRLCSICLLLDMLITLKNHFCFYSLGLRCLPCRHEQRRRRRQVWRQQRQRRATAHKWQLHHCDSHSNGIFKMHFIFQQKLDDNILFLSYCHIHVPTIAYTTTYPYIPLSIHEKCHCKFS